jgi:hypothetical protein
MCNGRNNWVFIGFYVMLNSGIIKSAESQEKRYESAGTLRRCLDTSQLNFYQQMMGKSLIRHLAGERIDGDTEQYFLQNVCQKRGLTSEDCIDSRRRILFVLQQCKDRASGL